jgi:hypothetical protein
MKSDTKEPTLAERTAACFANSSSTSIQIERLITETETALEAAQRKLEKENALALNPQLDPEVALQACKLAELEVKRLQNSLILLQQEYGKVYEKETKDRFHARQHEARLARDAASEQFCRIEALQQEMISIYNQAIAADRLVADANSGAPSGVDTRLLKTEEHARNLDGFTAGKVSLMKETVLYNFNGDQIWPPRSSIGAAYAAMMSPADPRSYPGDASAEWWKRGEAVGARQRDREQQIQHDKREFYEAKN